MTARRIGVAAAALAALAAVVAVLWPRPPPVGPCGAVADTPEIVAWRRIEVRRVDAPPGTGPASRVCRVAWRDGRDAHRTVVAVEVHRAAGGPPDRAGRAEQLRREGVDVRVVRPVPGRAIAVVPLDAEAWVEATIEDEQQGDVDHWVDRIVERRSSVRAALDRSGSYRR